jgi:hypothetical protein
VKCTAWVQKKSSSESPVEDFLKNENGQLMSPATRQVFPLFQPAIPLSQQELRLQRDLSHWLQAQWSGLASSQE